MISHRYRCIFVHIPRCGGTSIEDVIWPGERSEADLWMGFTSAFHNVHQTGGLQHLLASQIRQVVGGATFSAYYKFAVVRNPWDRAASQFASLRRRPDLRAYLELPAGAGFTDYLRRVAAGKPHVQWLPQRPFVSDGDGTILVDRLVRYESLATEMREVFRSLGIRVALPRTNASPRVVDGAVFDDEAVELVRSIYAEDLEAFGYDRPA